MKRQTFQPVKETELADFVQKLYKGHYRRDGKTPYYAHLIRVARRTIENEYRGIDFDNFFKDENVDYDHRKLYQIALLHDVIEDGLADRFDLMQLNLLDDVLGGVELLTKDKYDDYLDYIRRVKHDLRTRKIKIADILDNIGDHPTEKQIHKYAKALLILFDYEK